MAFKRWKKSPTKKPPAKLWPDNEMKVIGWCLQNNIEVGISPDWKDDMNRWQIDLRINGRLHTDPNSCLLYTSPSPRDGLLSRMPSSA